MAFFVLTSLSATVGKTLAHFLPAEGSQSENAPQYEECQRFVGMRRLVPPIRIELETLGGKLADIAFGPGDEILVYEAFKSAFAKANLRGMQRSRRVEILRGIQGSPVYFLAMIVRGRAAVDDDASGLVREQANVCSECRTGGLIKRAARIVIEEGTWSGEDIFYARGLPGAILATERLQHLVQAGDFKGFRFVPTEEFSFDFYPQEVSSR